jgi:hypothetical protein
VRCKANISSIFGVRSRTANVRAEGREGNIFLSGHAKQYLAFFALPAFLNQRRHLSAEIIYMCSYADVKCEVFKDTSVRTRRRRHPSIYRSVVLSALLTNSLLQTSNTQTSSVCRLKTAN